MEDGSKSTILKKAILSKYRSVRQFAAAMDMPYSTLVTALDRGIDGMAYSSVIRMCDTLGLNPVDFTSLEEVEALSAQITTKKVMDKYLKLNSEGRRRVMEIMEDYSQIPAYIEKKDQVNEKD